LSLDIIFCFSDWKKEWHKFLRLKLAPRHVLRAIATEEPGQLCDNDQGPMSCQAEVDQPRTVQLILLPLLPVTYFLVEWLAQEWSSQLCVTS